jgi:hypothetical protein
MSDSVPAINAGAGTAGTSSEISRADHDHGAATELKSATTFVGVAAATAPIAGQVLTATSSTAAEWQDITALTPSSSQIVLFDDFYSGQPIIDAGPTAGTGTLTGSELGWLFARQGSAAGTNSVTYDDFGSTGVARLLSGNGGGNVAYLMTGTTTPPNTALSSSRTIEMRLIGYTSVVAIAQAVNFRIGMIPFVTSSGGSLPAFTEGVYFSAGISNTATNWFANTVSGGIGTNTDTGVDNDGPLKV